MERETFRLRPKGARSMPRSSSAAPPTSRPQQPRPLPQPPSSPVTKRSTCSEPSFSRPSSPSQKSWSNHLAITEDQRVQNSPHIVQSAKFDHNSLSVSTTLSVDPLDTDSSALQRSHRPTLERSLTDFEEQFPSPLSPPPFSTLIACDPSEESSRDGHSETSTCHQQSSSKPSTRVEYSKSTSQTSKGKRPFKTRNPSLPSLHFLTSPSSNHPPAKLVKKSKSNHMLKRAPPTLPPPDIPLPPIPPTLRHPHPIVPLPNYPTVKLIKEPESLIPQFKPANSNTTPLSFTPSPLQLSPSTSLFSSSSHGSPSPMISPISSSSFITSTSITTATTNTITYSSQDTIGRCSANDYASLGPIKSSSFPLMSAPPTWSSSSSSTSTSSRSYHSHSRHTHVSSDTDKVSNSRWIGSDIHVTTSHRDKPLPPNPPTPDRASIASLQRRLDEILMT